MEWSDGDNWSLQVELSPGMTDFKCAVVRQDGSVAAWEPGANRTVEVLNLIDLCLDSIIRQSIALERRCSRAELVARFES